MNKEEKNVEIEDIDVRDSIETKDDNWMVVEEPKRKANTILKGSLVLLLTVGLIALMAWGGVKLYDLSLKLVSNKPPVEEQEVETNKEESNEVSSEYIGDYNKYIHHMTNTVIIPVDGKVRGTEEITYQTIDKALALVEGVDEYLYKEIAKWKEGNFDNSVDVHNYVWKNLGGEIGKAKKLNEEAIEKVKENL